MSTRCGIDPRRPQHRHTSACGDRTGRAGVRRKPPTGRREQEGPGEGVSEGPDQRAGEGAGPDQAAGGGGQLQDSGKI